MFMDNTEEIAQNKLLLLYIIKKSPYKFSKTQLNEFILEKNYINFFFLQQYLSELVESNLISIIDNDGESHYEITEKGNTTLKYFNTKIPEDIKLELEEEFNFHRSLQKKESQVISEFFQRENGQYTVNLRLVENEDVLFSLYLNVASEDQAQLICNAWKDRTDSIYMDIINMLIK